jgi:hypothetical protein
MSERPSSDSVAVSHHEDLEVRIIFDEERRWNTPTEYFKVGFRIWGHRRRPPLQPLSRRGSSVGRLQQSGSRWNPCSQAVFDAVASQAFVRPWLNIHPPLAKADCPSMIKIEENEVTLFAAEKTKPPLRGSFRPLLRSM